MYLYALMRAEDQPSIALSASLLVFSNFRASSKFKRCPFRPRYVYTLRRITAQQYLQHTSSWFQALPCFDLLAVVSSKAGRKLVLAP